MESPILQKNGLPFIHSSLNKEIAAAEMGSVRQAVSETVTSGMSPQKLASILKESIQGDPARYLAMAEEIEEKETQYATVIGTRKRQVSQLPIRVEAASESAEHQKHADFVRKFIERDELQEEMIDILDAISKGFSMTEIIWDTSSTPWKPVELKWRDPRWFDFDKTNRETPYLKGVNGLEPLPYAKFIFFKAKAKSGLPIRAGLARQVAWCWLFKNYDLKSWMQFLEVYGQPLRIGHYGSGASADDRSALLRAVTNIGRDAAAIIPQGMNLEFIESKANSGGALFKDQAEYFDQQISKVVLGQTTTTDAISGGHAVSKEHNEVRGDIERSDSNQLGAVLSRDLARPMIALNFGDQEEYPRIKIGHEDKTDVEAFTKSVSEMSAKGLPVSKKQIYEVTGIRAPEGKDDHLNTKPATDSKDEDEPKDEKPEKATASVKVDIKDKRDGLDEMAEDMLGDWQQSLDPVINPIQQALANASSFDEFKTNLSASLEDMKDDQLVETLTNGLATAHMIGSAGVPVGDAESE